MGKFTENLGRLKTYFNSLWEVNKKYVVLIILFRFIRALIPIGTLFVAKLIIDRVTYLYDNKLSSFNDFLEQDLALLVVIEFLLAILSDFISRYTSTYESVLNEEVTRQTSIDLMQQTNELDLIQIEDSEFQNKLNRARQQVSGQTRLLSNLVSQIQELITTISFGLGVIYFNPYLVSILLVAIIPSIFAELSFIKRRYSLSYNHTSERREMEYLRFLGTSSDSMKELKMFQISGYLTDRFAKISKKVYEGLKSLMLKNLKWATLFSVLGTIGYYAAYCYLLLQTMQGDITIGELIFLAGSFFRLRHSLEMTLMRFSNVSEDLLFLSDLQDFMKIKPVITKDQSALPFPKKIEKGIVLENVWFKYPNTEKWVLEDVNFEIGVNQNVALVGGNGAGKSTIIKLLSRLYEPTKGRILLDGIDLREYNLAEVRKYIAVMFQDYIKYQMTVSNNIGLGAIGSEHLKERIRVSAFISHAYEVIANLPHGYGQVLGKRFKNGMDLSGGQWQQIALSRTFVGDSHVIILDEPTAALDASAEYRITKRCLDYAIGKIAIIISHRFSTIRLADKIVILENGTVKEVGNHDELIKKDTLYAKLFNLQAQGYL